MNRLTALAGLALTLAFSAGDAPAAVDRSAPPEATPPRPLSPPPAYVHRLANGLTVHLVEMHEVPVVEMVLVARNAGAASDPAGREGLAFMVADMLDEGAGGRDALETADALDFLGAQLETAANWDAGTVRLRVPVARLPQALPVFADVVRRPDFSAADLARLREEALTGLLQARDEPRAIAMRALHEAVFGAAHRYGRPDDGTASSLSALTTDMLTAFHGARYVPGETSLVVVGDVTREAVLALVRDAFGDWPSAAGAAADSPSLAAPAQVDRQRMILVDKPGAVQSVILVGRVGPGWGDEDHHAVDVMNTLLGGSFTSRLNDNLREQNGYTYGAFSAPRRFGAAGLYALTSTAVQTDKTAPAIREVYRELGRIRSPAAAQEVTRARNYTALGFAASFETTGQVAQRIVEQVVYDLPADFFAQYVPGTLAVDARAVQAAAEKHVVPEASVLVVVGDRGRVGDTLAALDVGEVEYRSISDVMGPPPAPSKE
jgi:predicted Zn-dependent peptidase